MVKDKILVVLLLIFFQGCSSRLLVSTKGCLTNARWNNVEREFVSSIGDKYVTDIKYQKKYFDYVFVERIWTPLGQMSREKLNLREFLWLNGLQCSQIKSIEITYFSDTIDAFSSIIPLLSSRSVMLKVKTH